MQIVDIHISKIRRSLSFARPLDRDVVRGLMESIREQGILNPITVRPAKLMEGPCEVDGWEIVAGHHRYKAAKELNIETVPCICEAYDDIHAELASIDENLMRAGLNPAQESHALARRKAIYEELHPETKHGGDRRSYQVANLSTRNDRFTESYYAASFYLVGFLDRAAVVCPSEEAMHTAKAALDLFREPELKAIERGFPKKTKRWMLAGVNDFNADIMKKGIGSACGDALEIRTGAEKLTRPE